MFTEFCKHGRKIILETHSEYFLLRLRYHIVKENFPNNLAAVNFFQNTGGTKVTYANISGFGNIDYPEDFRDETQELLNAIMEASLDRKGLS
jgi:predicted ATPase